MKQYFILIFLGFLAISCKNISDAEVVEHKINALLEYEIQKYIAKNKLDCHCSVMIDFFNMNNGYKILNITNTREERLMYSEIIPKVKIGCVNVYFFTGVEEYFIVPSYVDSVSNKIMDPCGNDDIMIIDSMGIFSTYRDIFLYPNCEY